MSADCIYSGSSVTFSCQTFKLSSYTELGHTERHSASLGSDFLNPGVFWLPYFVQSAQAGSIPADLAAPRQPHFQLPFLFQGNCDFFGVRI